MRISHARAWFEEIPLTRPYAIAFAAFERAPNVFVELELADGTRGLGAGAPVAAITGEDPQACYAALRDGLADWLVGQDLRRLHSLLARLASELPHLPAARAAVDLALHDLVAKKLDLPLVELFGRVHDALPTSITLGLRSPSETVAEAREYLDRGFRVLKLKTGVSVAQDLAVLTELRAAVGPQIKIRVDANQAYSRADLLAFWTAAEPLAVEFIEQPLPASESDAMRALPAALRDRAAADESLHAPADALALATPSPPFGIFNIKLMKCGGTWPARQIANIAQLAGIAIMWGSMDESVVAIAGALHTAFACPATRYLDLDGSLDLARDPARFGFTLDAGVMRTLARPGLGVELQA